MGDCDQGSGVGVIQYESFSFINFSLLILILFSAKSMQIDRSMGSVILLYS